MQTEQLVAEKAGTGELRSSSLDFPDVMDMVGSILTSKSSKAGQSLAALPPRLSCCPAPLRTRTVQVKACLQLPWEIMNLPSWEVRRRWGLLVYLGFGWFIGTWQTLSFGSSKVDSQPACPRGLKRNNHLLASLAAMNGHFIYSAWEKVW